MTLNGKNRQRMYEWIEWDEAAETTPDLSYEANQLGLIPLSCRGKISRSGRTCSTKVFDAPQTEIREGKKYRKVQCLLCGHKDFRKVGLKK